MSWHTLDDFVDEDQIGNFPGSPVDSSPAMLCPEHNIVVAEGATAFYFFDSRTGSRLRLASIDTDLLNELVTKFARYLEVGIE